MTSALLRKKIDIVMCTDCYPSYLSDTIVSSVCSRFVCVV